MRKKGFSFPVTTLAGTSFLNFLAVCRGHKIELKYLAKFLLSIVVSLIFEIFNAVERRIWQRRIARFKPEEPPVFIIGPWRSGTTLLHNLLCQDPKAAYTTTFQAVFPNVVLTQASWVKPIANYLGPSKRPFDNVTMDMDYPQEEEFGLMNMQPSSIYKFFIFPSDFDRIISEEFNTGALPESRVKLWKTKYLEMIAKASFNTRGTRYISKNPCNLGRLALLKEMFPQAKFIFIYRDPYKATESLYRFIGEIFHGVQLQATPPEYTRKSAVLLYEKTVRAYLDNKNLIDPENLLEIKMEDFLKDPHDSIRQIYKKFKFDKFGELAPVLDKYLASEGQSRNNVYEIDEETIRLVNNNLGDIINKLGYETLEVETAL
jgi:hypothetical protein